MEFDSMYLRVLKFLNFRPRSEKEVRDYLQKILRKAQGKNFSTRSTRSKKKHLRYVERSEESKKLEILKQVQDDREQIARVDSGQAFRSRVQNEARMTVQDENGFVDLIIHKLKQQRFLNDSEFARWLVRSRTEFKPKGKYVIQQELRQKGIAQDIIDEVLAQERSATEEDLATGVLLAKKRKYEGMEPQERFNKAGSMLARRGFSLDAIKTAIDRVFEKMV